MKIEIEIEEIEKLKRTINELYAKNSALEGKIEQLKPVELKQKAVMLALNLTGTYLNATFKALGFNEKIDSLDYVFQLNENFNDLLDARVWEFPALDVKLNIHITEAMKNAFIKIGIDRTKLNDC
ncbi:MAG: hypothetical protein ABIJ97_17545 [Bacteroidota bacterium]